MNVIFTRSAADADQAWRQASVGTTVYLHDKPLGTVQADFAKTDEQLRRLHAQNWQKRRV